MTRILLDIDEAGKNYVGPLLLTSGHRPFFLMAAAWAALGLALWVAAFAGLIPGNSLWHGHEMVFGFGVCAISGFLMAAVPKWTGMETPQGWKLGLLVFLWIIGRAGMLVDVPQAQWLDLFFLPALAGFIMHNIVSRKNKRNYQVPAILFALAALNAMYHFGDPVVALHTGTFVIISMIALIGGRIIPAFTQNGLRMHLRDPEIVSTTPEWADKLAVPVIFSVVLAELFAPGSLFSGLAALAAGLLLLVRMLKWNTFKSFSVPLIWILHAGYVWLPIGFLLKAASDLLDLVPPSQALHALTAGGIGVTIMAVASRAALGHSGRPLAATKPTVICYWLVIASAILRVVFPTMEGIIASGILWTAGWLLFAIVYWPILAKPRIDGMPG